NWGFPTYRWSAMAEDGYGWWQKRLAHLSRYFDAVRLDHVIGFARIWRIPADAISARRGHFHPAQGFTEQELRAVGITPQTRLTEPYLTDESLAPFSLRLREALTTDFLTSAGDGTYRFRPPYASQRTFMAACAGRLQFSTAEAERLLLLHDEVVLIPETTEGGIVYHPAIAMETTRSFSLLPPETRETLRLLSGEYYGHRQETLWEREARKKLGVLREATGMLLCAEDLGMVPRCIPRVLERLGILSLRIQRMPKETGRLYDDPATYPYLSVASPSTHDVSTLRGWWEETDRAVIQIFYEHFLQGAGVAPRSCTPELCRRIVEAHLQSPSMWAVFPIQDLLGMNEGLRRADVAAERINDPAVPHHRWQFRLHLTLEELMYQHTFANEFRKMLRAAGRGGDEETLS
ncbi:MAG: 4-alpha-glucanotransferase, partial [Syntrophales bacterium]|nr:4-alpha-glucanotransferase [Syntrophales bacterium]